MESASGSAVFSMGEFDTTRHAYMRQFENVRTEARDLNAKLTYVLAKLINLKKRSLKRQRALDEFGSLVAELMNKNMFLLQITGGIEENQYYMDSVKLSFRIAGGGK